jgi:hypothetical protein
MKSLVAFLALPFLLSSCMVVDTYGTYPDGNGGDDWRNGNGTAVTETRYLPAFSTIESQSPIRVTVKTGSDYAAYVTADGNLTSYIVTTTHAGVLTVELSTEISPTVTPEVVVVTPDLRQVIHDGSGFVDVQEGGDFPDLSLQLNGSGTLRFDGTATRLHAELNGYGRMTLQGYAAVLQTELRGQGDISAENLLAGDASVSLSGTGNVFLDLDYQSTLDLDLSGAGRVEWWGAPARLDYNLTGTGTVIEHRGLPKMSAKSGLAKKGAGGKYTEDLKSAEYVTREVAPPGK